MLSDLLGTGKGIFMRVLRMNISIVAIMKVDLILF